MFCLRIQPEIDDAPILGELLAAIEIDASSWRDAATQCVTFRVFTEAQEDAERARARLLAELPQWQDLLNDGDSLSTEIIAVRDEDWAEAWKQYFHLFRVSDRLVVRPSWEAYESKPGEVVVEIDPGMCFGTGHHGTTRACLEFMDELAARYGSVSFLDAGCGSGILSLAAVRLGYGPVRAFDHDPDAAMVTRENLERAGHAADVDVCTADLADFVPAAPYRVVAANILAPVLIQNATGVVDWVEPAGYLLLSGILSEQYAEVRDLYVSLGVVEERTRCIGEWTSGCFRKPAAVG